MKSAHDLVAMAREQIHEVTLEDVEQALQDADLLIDVREPEEFHQAHIPGAINIPRGVLEFNLSSSPDMDRRDLNIVLYCKTSGRAALAAQSLGAMGYFHVKSIAGGFDAWVEAGNAVAKPQTPDYD